MRRCLGEIANINMGQSPKSSSYNNRAEGMPFFQGNADFGKINPKVRVWCSEPKKTAAKGDILLSVRAPIGALNMANQDCCIGRGLAALTANEDICRKDYMWYALKSRVDELVFKGTGSTFKAIGKDVLKNLSIPLPILSEQIKIAEQLHDIDCAIDICERLLLSLDQLVKSRFVELFGDPVINDKGWIKDKLENHADVMVGYPFPSAQYTADGIPIVGGYNLMQGFVQWESSKFWSDENGYEQYLLKDKDIVIAMDRPWVGNGFKIATIGKTNLPAILIQRTACIRCKDITTEFLYRLLDSTWFADHCQITGSLVPHISNKDILSYEIIMPPVELQNQFADFVTQAYKSKSAVQQSIDTLQTLNDKLMQDYFG